MSMIFVVLPLGLLIATAAVLAFIWAARSGQFDDMETPQVRVLFDDEPGRLHAPTEPDGPAGQDPPAGRRS